MTRRCQYCGRGGTGIHYSVRLERNCCTHCYQAHTPPAPNPRPTRPPAGPDPHTRPLDRTLEGLRAHHRDAYRLEPGTGGRDPGRWRARCPLHPDGPPSDPFTLTITDYGNRWPLVVCRAGCPAAALRRLVDPELDEQLRVHASTIADALTWAEQWRHDGQANYLTTRRAPRIR